MLRVFQSEIYYAFHSLIFWIFLVMMIIMSIFMTRAGMSFDGTDQAYYIWDTDGHDAELDAFAEEANTDELQNAVTYSETYGRYSMRQALWNSPFLSVPEKYENLLGRDDLHTGYHVTYDFYMPAGEADFEHWALYKMSGDTAGTAFTTIFFAIFFLGKSYASRTYSAAIIHGVKRRNMILGKLLAYFAVNILFVIIEVLICFHVYAPVIFGLNKMLILKLLAIRLTYDLCLISIVAVFSVFIRVRLGAFFACFAFVFLFFSNRAIVPTPLDGWFASSINAMAWGKGISSAFLSLLIMMVGIYTAVTVASVIYMQRVNLK